MPALSLLGSPAPEGWAGISCPRRKGSARREMHWSLITVNSQEVYGLGTLFCSMAANMCGFSCAWECLSELISLIQYFTFFTLSPG